MKSFAEFASGVWQSFFFGPRVDESPVEASRLKSASLRAEAGEPNTRRPPARKSLASIDSVSSDYQALIGIL